MNHSIEKIITRHAIRRYTKQQVDSDTLDQILQAGLYAPSAGNNQRTIIVVSQDEQVNEKLGQLSRWAQFKNLNPATVARTISSEQPSILDDLNLTSGFYGAPTVLTIFSSKNNLYTVEDAAMVAQNIQLAAHFLDIASCYIGRTGEVFTTDYGQNLLQKWNIPEDYLPIGNVLLGYREGPEPSPKPRREGRILKV